MKRRFKNCQPNDPFRSELAGYRWGMNRKRLLLLREQEMFPDPQSLFARPALMKGHWITVAR
jgi:hypothetical protein